MKLFAASGLVVFCIAVTGCGKKSIWDVAASELPNAQAEARAAGLAVEMTELPQNKLAPEKNAATHYNIALASHRLAVDELRDDTKLWMETVSGNPATSRVRASLLKRKIMLDEVRKGAVLKECIFEKDPGLGLDEDHPEYLAMKDWGKAFAAEAVLAARDRDVARAQQNLVIVQNIARHAAEGDTIIAQLVAVAISKTGLRAGERVLGEGGPRFAGAIQAMANAVPEIKMLDVLDYECAGGAVSIRNLDLNNPPTPELKAEIAKAQAADPGLKPGLIKRAFETRYLQFWTKVAKQAKGLEGEALGKLMDDLAVAEVALDDTYLLNKVSTGGIHARAGNAIESVEAKKRAALTVASILSGSKPDVAAAKYGTIAKRTTKGYSVTSKTFKAPAEAKPIAYSFVYPHRGGG